MSLRQRFHRAWTGVVISTSLFMVAFHHLQRRAAYRRFARDVKKWSRV